MGKGVRLGIRGPWESKRGADENWLWKNRISVSSSPHPTPDSVGMTRQVNQLPLLQRM